MTTWQILERQRRLQDPTIPVVQDRGGYFQAICRCGEPTIRKEGRHCTECHLVQPLSEFHARAESPDGKLAKCKQCCHRKYRETEKARAVRQEWAVKYRDTEQAKIASKAWSVKHPDSRRMIKRVVESVRAAIRKGVLVRPTACEQCGASGVIEAAHFDYSRRLDVRWLCRSCHRKWDSAEPKVSHDRLA